MYARDSEMFLFDLAQKFRRDLLFTRGNNVQFLMHVFVPSVLFMSVYLELSVKMAFSTSSPYRHGRKLGIRTDRSHPCLG